MLKRIKNLGPGLLITAAFIGPGTVTLCSIAGYKFGYALLWALVFSVITTIILQEMSARLGVVTQKGLAAAIRSEIKHPLASLISIVLVLSAILIGNTAYEAGNISGAVMGMDTILGEFSFDLGALKINLWSVLIGLIALILLISGSYKLIEKFMIGLVILMSILFLLTAFLIRPVFLDILEGMFMPSIPAKSIITIIGLIGTTVVPYNLFLHASSVSKKWKRAEDLPEVRLDTILSIVLGGIISMAIIVTSAAAIEHIQDIKNASDLAIQLEPLLGSWSKYCLAGGLFAAGITSSVTAPLAAAFATVGILGKSNDIRSPFFRGVMIVMILIGVVFSSIGFSPIMIIQFAQVANGILLPIIGIFLVWVMNRTALLGKYRNSLLQNILGIIVILITIGLGIKSVGSVFDIL
jgi:Mn2+/Fe2+ NRAMP family transporter